MRSNRELISSFSSDDGTKRVNLFALGITEFVLDGEVVKTIDLSYLTNQELEARAEEFIRLN